jgi:EmrB/QacA subfamily drug resistance transporter
LPDPAGSDPAGSIRFGTPTAHWVLAATVLGSGIAFLDGTVVNVALPAIARDLGADVAGLQWTVDAYLVSLTAFLLLGGALGDRFGRRRIYVIGLVGFTAASVGCALAPDPTALALARGVQGVGGAFLVPGSLAILAATFDPAQRSRAIGAWSGLSGIATALGPFVGGWLVDAVSWRLVFLINVPLALVAIAVTLRHVPETRAEIVEPLDFPGALLASVGLAATCWALIESADGFGAGELGAGIVGVGALVAFIAVEATSSHPMLPLRLFRSRQFSGANGTTLAVYAALGGATFLVVLELQLALGYSALEAGSALLPITVLMLLLSSRMGALAQRIGARIPMTVGPLIMAIGLVLFGRVGPGSTFFADVLPASTVFALGLAVTVAPLTATVLGALEPDEFGVGSGVNNAAARLAGLLAVAVLPAAVGLDTGLEPQAFSDRVSTALHVCAVLAAAGALVSWLTVRGQVTVVPTVQADVGQPCHDPCRAQISM